MELQTEPQSKDVHLPRLNNWGDGSWREHAACRGKATRMFFPEKECLDGLTLSQKQRKQARKDMTDPTLPGNSLSQARLLCVKCPVRTECLKFAVENGLTYGMYGGIPSRDRRTMTVNNLDARIPMRHVMRDLQRVRRMHKRDRTVPLSQDLGLLLDIPTSRAEKMLRNNDLPEFV